MSLLRRLLCGLCLLGSAVAATPGHPNVILITLDTVRADRMGFLGSTRGLTPNLDALAQHSVVFTRAYAQVPLTTASHATILTGTYPQFHGVNDFDVPLGASLPYAPAILKAQGYTTAAFVGSIILDPKEHFAPGFDRGFSHYDAGFHRRRPKEDRYQAVERRGFEVVDHALAWLKIHPRGPFFVWIHLYDAHDPYEPPEPFQSRYAKAPYDGEIAYVDAAVGRFVSELRARSLYDDSLIAVMADHGEALGDHGEDTHGVFLYDETIRVPLLMKFPRQAAGRHVETRVQLVDVLPTMLQVAGVRPVVGIQGTSLMSLASAPRPTARAGAAKDSSGTQERPAYSETDYPQRAFGWSSIRSLRSGKYLFVEAPQKELYDQASDPQAEHNLSNQSGAVAQTLLEKLEAFRKSTANIRAAVQAKIDPEQQEKLNALGYISSGSTAAPQAGITEKGTDPKQKIAVVNLLHRAVELGEELRYAEAAPLLEQAIAMEPDLPVAYLQLGTAYSQLQEFEKALPVLRKAVELRPDLPVPHYQLGMALFETGDVTSALPEFQAAVSRFPTWPEARFSLATALARTNRFTEAIGEYRQVVALRPNHYGAHLLLGRSLARSGDPAGALTELTTAAALQPQSPEPHAFLSDAYRQLGRDADAERERVEAERLKAGGSQ